MGNLNNRARSARDTANRIQNQTAPGQDLHHNIFTMSKNTDGAQPDQGPGKLPSKGDLIRNHAGQTMQGRPCRADHAGQTMQDDQPGSAATPAALKRWWS
jgi:hypothetical protein